MKQVALIVVCMVFSFTLSAQNHFIGLTARPNWKNEAAFFDFGGILELGGGYNIYEKLRFYTSVSYQHSLSSITNTNFFSGEKIRNRGLNLTLTIMYAISPNF